MQKSAMSPSRAYLERRPFALSLMKNVASLLRMTSKISWRSCCVSASSSVISFPIVPNWAPASHSEPPLQFNVRQKPFLQVVPRFNLIVNLRTIGGNSLTVDLQHLMNEALFAAELVVEVALSRSRCFHDLIRAGGAYALLVKQV